MLNDAIKYRKLGWSVVPACWPVGGKCGCGYNHSDAGKQPLVKWKEFQDRLPTIEEINGWWRLWPHANVACITGAISGIAVVDLEHEGLAEAQRLGLHSGLIALTGKGRHLFYRHPGEDICNKVKLRGIKGLDIRGDGGYVIIPPSLHANGKRYRWATSITSHVPVFPSQLTSVATSGESSRSIIQPTRVKGRVSELLEGLEHGNRNSTFAQIIGLLHRDRWPVADIRALLLPHAMRVQLPETELDTVVGSITKYPVGIIGRGTGQPLPVSEPLVIRRFSSDWKDYERRIAKFDDCEFATGFNKLDRVCGGLQRGELFTVAARTETGKTNWLLRVAKTLASANKRVLFLSTEMSYERIWQRYIPLGDLNDLDDANFIIADAFRPDIPRIAQAIEDNKPDLFVFDHINIVGDIHDVIAEFMRGLKLLARDFGIPGIVSAQISRQADWIDPRTGHKMLPRMSQIKGSSMIEETSAFVLLLHEQANEPDHKQILGLVEKNRYGEKENIQFILRKHPYRMEEQS